MRPLFISEAFSLIFGNVEVGVELEYLDSRMKRFRKILDQWELERDMEIEGNK